MSKGYYCVQINVFHSKDERDDFVDSTNWLKLTRLQHRKLMLSLNSKNKPVKCRTCEQYHEPDSVYKKELK